MDDRVNTEIVKAINLGLEEEETECLWTLMGWKLKERKNIIQCEYNK